MKTELLHSPLGATSDSEAKKTIDATADHGKSPHLAAKEHPLSPAPFHIYKHSPINSDWASEVVKSYGLSGPFAEILSAALVKVLEERIIPAITRDKLNKIVLNAVAENLDKQSFPYNSEGTLEI